MTDRPGIHEECLQERLKQLHADCPHLSELIQELESFVRTASDDRVIRINPLSYAAAHGRDDAEVIDLLLHGRRAGLLTMGWLYVCRNCGMIVEGAQTLSSSGRHFFCNTCLADREIDLSDFVEVSFSVSKAVRTSRFHTPEELSAEELILDYQVSDNAVAADGSKARDLYRRHNLFLEYVAPGETKEFSLVLRPGFVWLRHGPELSIAEGADQRADRIEIVHRDGRPAEGVWNVAPGPLTYVLSNASDARIVAQAISLSADKLQSMRGANARMKLSNYLSGSRLLANQTFLDLFPFETAVCAGGLAIKSVALLFTDIKGSTALYDRIGDLQAFDLVRQHFGLLRQAIASNRGALVKTIGDAVMASFHDPSDAVRTAMEMMSQIGKLNAAAGEELIALKVGAHVGPCLAVTLNERLDYFGQTVNLAARVQRLAEAGEIFLTDELFGAAGVEAITASLQRESMSVGVDGVVGARLVHRLRPPLGAGPKSHTRYSRPH